ncbi:MAG TPA: lytic transglycosylase domain-containing protein [Longimicrobiaceae bacterium]|nr:lytic transglycosylase domain-containing protein [Longimicrobiaceae bacterium]
MQSLLLKLQADVEARKRPRWDSSATVRSALLGGIVCLAAFLLGARAAAVAEGSTPLAGVRAAVQPAGMVDLQRVEIERLKRIYANSARYGIPADLAERIEDIARAEGIDPELAFGLVSVESEFNHRAVSPVGAVGYTQLMPSTARYFQPGIRRSGLFDRDTNLRIGFRFLRTLLDKYKGNVRLALLAYNRGPERVDELLRQGIDPDNGYVELVMRKRKGKR